MHLKYTTVCFFIALNPFPPELTSGWSNHWLPRRCHVRPVPPIHRHRAASPHCLAHSCHRCCCCPMPRHHSAVCAHSPPLRLTTPAHTHRCAAYRTFRCHTCPVRPQGSPRTLPHRVALLVPILHAAYSPLHSTPTRHCSGGVIACVQKPQLP
ncbi:hypothetical protein B0H14DRAFT_2703055 [Mycena olivaceomarginata]|nr:hypothetical protein B0H14DRAFT_2703055 [Mycena olivaceomarginata]